MLFLTYHQYVDRWDELSGIFSRDAVLKGSFDKFAESTKFKRGTAGVDTAFLEEIESWREVLARNFSLRNDVDQRDLNFAVQRTIDRLIFLRMCEDRGISLEDVHDAIAEIDVHRAEIANYVRQALSTGQSKDNPILTFYPQAEFVMNGGHGS